MGFLEELWNNQSSIVIGSGIVILVLFGIYIQLLNTYKQLFISNSLRFAKKIQERYSFEGVGDLNKKEENLTSSPNWKYVWSSTIEAGDVCDALMPQVLTLRLFVGHPNVEIFEAYRVESG